MIFSIANDGIEWSLDSGPDTVTLTVKDLVHEKTINSQEIPQATWSFLLSQKQQFLNNLLARVPVTTNQQGTHEMRHEVLSSVGEQDVDTSGYQVSADLHDVEFYWENDQLDVHAVFRLGIDTPFSPTSLEKWIWEVKQKTPFCSTKRNTRRTLLQQQQQHQSLKGQHNPLHC